MISYKWCKGIVPKDIEIKQVYGIVFNEDGILKKSVQKLDIDPNP